MGHWTGTQADAKKLAKQHNTTCDVFEVPVDKKGLLDFLNEHQVNTLSDHPAAPEEVTAPAVEEVKIVGQTREQYMRNWRQEQADLGAEFDVRIAIEDALWESPLHELAGYTSVVISRLGECIHVEKTEGVVKMRKLREGER
jgi:hypothetical protein